MSDLKDMLVVPDDVASAAFVLLNSDATLKGASYLNSSNAIFKQSVPRNAPIPRLLVVGGMGNPDKDSHLYTFLLDVEARARNTDDGLVANSKLLNALIKRTCYLLVGHGTLSRTGYRFFDVILTDIGPTLEAPNSAEESVLLARFTVDCRKL